MTFEAGLAAALVRAAAAALAATLIAWPIARWLSAARACSGRAAWATRLAVALLLAMLLMPGLVVGYAWSGVSLHLMRSPWLNELLYAGLLCLRLTPVAVGVLYFAPPPPISAAGRHCRRLAPRGSLIRRLSMKSSLSFVLRSPVRSAALSAAAVFVLAFADFEMASLLNMASGRRISAYSWTIWQIDAQRTGVPLRLGVAKAALAAAVQLAVLGAGLVLLLRTRGRMHVEQRAARGAAAAGAFTWGYLLAAVAAVCGYPAWVVMRGAVRGFEQLAAGFTIGPELAASVGFALAGSVSAVLLSWWCVNRRGVRVAWSIVLSLPGTLGALILALLMLAVFIDTPVYDTPAPLWLTLTLLLLPIAILLRCVIHLTRDDSALHLAALMRRSQAAGPRRAGAQLRWRLHRRKLLWLAVLLFVWTYFDVVASALLAPTSATTLTVQLYNQMHYGQMDVLSAMTAVMVATPVVLVIVVWLLAAAGRRVVRWWAN